MYLPVVAAAAGISAVDTVWADLGDTEGFIQEVQQAKSLGFSGKSCIHPSQLSLVHDIFMPSAEDIESAQNIISAMKQAEAEGIGVVTVNGKMVDEPVVSKARRILIQAGKGDDCNE